MHRLFEGCFLYKRYFKRIIDILCALLAILCFSWLYLLLAMLVRWKLGSPVIFRQERPGKDEKIFTIYKFRTMTSQCDEKGRLLPDCARLTGFGRFLRSTSLDELPEAFNILKGDMSVVGPRPLSPLYLPYYTETERQRHRIRPGLTGLAQINGRNALSWEERFAYDVSYIDRITFRNDIKIILLTIKKALTRSGIGQAQEAPESLHIQRVDIVGTERGKVVKS